MAQAIIITTTTQLNEVQADHFGMSETTHTFKQYGRFTEDVIEAKYDFWYNRWNALHEEEAIYEIMSNEQWLMANERASRMMNAWHNRLIEYRYAA